MIFKWKKYVNKINELFYTQILLNLNKTVAVIYFFLIHNGVVGVAGSNPVVPTLFKDQRKRAGLFPMPNKRILLT